MIITIKRKEYEIDFEVVDEDIEFVSLNWAVPADKEPVGQTLITDDVTKAVKLLGVTVQEWADMEKDALDQASERAERRESEDE